MFAKKSLGQHFLHAESVLDTIIDTSDVTGNDVILEIGPGRGALTDKLLAFAGKVIAVEKDDDLYAALQEKYAKEVQSDVLDLIHGDALEFDASTLSFYKDLSYKLVANIPYNITGAIIRKFLSADTQPERMVLLVQKEVAERIARDPKESILSISVKAYGTPKYIQTVKAGSFNPPPKVDSAILLVEDISKKFFQGFSEDRFFELVRAGFASKRKKLSSNLSTVVDKAKITATFAKLELSDNTRAEDVSIEEWGKLAALLA